LTTYDVLVQVVNKTWNLDAIKEHAIGVNAFWQTSKIPRLRALQDKPNAVEPGSLWDQLMQWVRAKPRPAKASCNACVPWPDDPLDANLQSMVPWATAPLRRKHVLLKELGSGSFGAVYEARSLVTGDIVAVKIANSEKNHWGGLDQSSAFEIAMLNRCQSEYVVQLHDAFLNASMSVIVMERMTMTVHERVRNKPLTHLECPIMVNHLWNAMDVVHECGCVHRDIKSNNVLISGEGQGIVAKLSDFGRACTHSVDVAKSHPNPMYSLCVRPPEFLFACDAVWHRARVTYSTNFCKVNCFKSDVFAMAACITPLVGGPSFGGESEWHAGRRMVELLHPAIVNAPAMLNKALHWRVPVYEGMERTTEFSRWARDMGWPSSVLVMSPDRRDTAKNVLASIGSRT
jgi:serine/threonine protein kinase